MPAHPGDPGGPGLLSPFRLRGALLRNRTVVSAMTQCSAVDGVTDDYHLVHLGRFALGGFGMVLTECLAVTEAGRSSWGDAGLWSDEHLAPLARVAEFVRAHGAVPAAQLGHAGRRAGQPRPWLRDGATEGCTPDPPWPWPLEGPAEMSAATIAAIPAAFAAAAARAAAAGFGAIELHMAHAYFLSQCLAPGRNGRTDGYGGTRAGRARLPLEVVEHVRKVLPRDVPVLVKLSAVDEEGGVGIDDTMTFVRELADRGVDLIDVSTTPHPGQHLAYGYQVRWAERIRAQTGVPTMAAGLITEPRQADAVVREERADLVAIARQALADPNWPLRAHAQLRGPGDDFAAWPRQSGMWLRSRQPVLERLGAWSDGMDCHTTGPRDRISAETQPPRATKPQVSDLDRPHRDP